MEARRRRIAENEVRFRGINEALRERVEGLPLEGDRVTFVCECGQNSCTEPLALTLAEYEHVRAVATHFAVLDGHEILDVERVVERLDGHLVIEKHVPPGREIAERTDPRA